MLGHQNGEPAGQPVEPSDHQENQGTGAPDGRQGVDSDKSPGDDGVRQVIKLLENIPKAGGDHKIDNQLHRIPGGHIVCHSANALPSVCFV